MTELSLPPCPLPRPGEAVTFYHGGRRTNGLLVGHMADGKPYILIEWDKTVPAAGYDAIRRTAPLTPRGPNWEDVRPEAIVHPSPEEAARFAKVLDRTVPPGRTYREFAEEIALRGPCGDVLVQRGSLVRGSGAQPFQYLQVAAELQPLPLSCGVGIRTAATAPGGVHAASPLHSGTNAATSTIVAVPVVLVPGSSSSNAITASWMRSMSDRPVDVDPG